MTWWDTVQELAGGGDRRIRSKEKVKTTVSARRPSGDLQEVKVRYNSNLFSSDKGLRVIIVEIGIPAWNEDVKICNL